MSKEKRYLFEIDWFWLFFIIWMLASMFSGRGCWAEPKDSCEKSVDKIEETVEETTKFIDDRFN